jgi:hypothetical protein
MPRGLVPAAISATTASFAVSITLTVPEPSFGTYAKGAALAVNTHDNPSAIAIEPLRITTL